MEIQANGIRIHVSEQGDGERTVVFLHYWGGSSRTWQFVTEELSDAYRIVATDHRGWGHSDAPEGGYRIADLADDAQGVIEGLGLSRYVLVGHSMGGKVAQLLASRRLRGLEGLVLVAPSPPSPMALSDEQRAVLVSAYDSRESVGWVLDHVLTGSPLAAERREQVIEDSLRGAPQAKAAWPNVAMREDITADVAAIDVPVLVIAGERDQVDRLETLQAELLPRIPHAHLEVLPGIGHLSPLEAPSAVAAAIRRFVGELAGGARAAERVPAVSGMAKTTPEQNKAMVLEAFDTLFNQRDYVAAERFWSDRYIQHSAHIAPGRGGLFDLVRTLPATLRYENQLIMAEGDYVIAHGRFSGHGRPAAWIAADIVRFEGGKLAEHWDVLQDEATQAQSLSGLPMFGDRFPA